jgi:hypothetical protein
MHLLSIVYCSLMMCSSLIDMTFVFEMEDLTHELRGIFRRQEKIRNSFMDQQQ